MVRLVGVLGEGEAKKATKQCLSRRQLPLTIEPELTMIMALDDYCMACGCDRDSRLPPHHCSEVATFLRNYRSLVKDECDSCLKVCGTEVTSTLSQLVSCVGCRRSVENLYQTLILSGDHALQPLTISPDGVVSVSRDHRNSPESLANLFVTQAGRLSRSLLGWQGGEGGKGRGRRGGSGRCAQHSLGVRRLVTMGNWLDTWDTMEKECKEEVVLIPYSALRETLDHYLKKHSFCSECTNMVNRAYTLLVEEGKEPARAAGEKPADSDPNINDDGSINLYSGISACTKESHIHVRCDPQFISQLFTLAEPELSGLRQERHAKTIEIAQKEVLTCIGIALFERFQRIQQKLKEGEQTCDLLLLVCLKSLRRSLDMAAERKRGVAADIDLLCQELEQDEKRKEGRRERKRKRRERKREVKNCSSGGGDERDSDVESMTSCDSGMSSSESQLCEVSKSVAKDCKKHYIEEEEFDKENSPKFFGQIPAKTGSWHKGRKEDLILRPLPRPVLSLTAMLEEEEGEEEETIPMEEIRSFYDTKEETALRRQELRENLKRRFAALCVSGMT